MGGLLFKNPDFGEPEILQLLRLAIGVEALTYQHHRTPAVIYKLTFDENIGNYLLGLPLDAPRTDPPPYGSPRILLIKYTCDLIDDPDFNVEARVHFEIATARTPNNIFSISPSFITSKIIQSGTTPLTTIGTEFRQLLTRNNLIATLEDYVVTNIRSSGLPEGNEYYKQSIIIMEWVDGITLHQELSRVAEDVSIVNPIPDIPFTFTKTFLQNFYTCYLLTLLAKKGYSHGDPHSANILLVSTTGDPPFFLNAFGDFLTRSEFNVVPYLIDFGRAAPFYKLKFEQFTHAQLSDETIQRVAAYYLKIYNDAVPHLDSGKTIEELVTNLLTQDKYVEAVLLLTMCGYKHESPFQIAFREGYKGFNNLFSITREDAVALNLLLRQAFDDRETLEQAHITYLQTQRQLHARSAGKYRVKKTKTRNRNKNGNRNKNRNKSYKKKMKKTKTRN